MGLLISEKSLYKKYKQSINASLFENDVHKKLLNCILAYYDIDKSIDAGAIMSCFSTDEEINEVSLILSLDNKTDDPDKAFNDYLRIINDGMNKKNILNLLGNKNPDSIEKLNKIIKNQ